MRHLIPRLASLFTLTLLLLAPAAVMAHAELDVPTPADEATVEGTPASIEGTFTEPLVTNDSSLQLRDAAGDLVAEGGVVDGDGQRMAIDPVPELAPGTYEVRWTSLSAVDPHVERGTWSFTVTSTPTPEPTPEPTSTPVASDAPTAEPTLEPTGAPTVEPTPSPSDDGDPAASEADVILPIIAALAIVGIAGVVLLNRRGRATDA